jgi:hypothetical protein
MSIATKARSRTFLCSQAAPNLMPSLKDTNAQTTVPHEVHSSVKACGSASDYYRIKSLVRHSSLLKKFLAAMFVAKTGVSVPVSF